MSEYPQFVRNIGISPYTRLLIYPSTSFLSYPFSYLEMEVSPPSLLEQLEIRGGLMLVSSGVELVCMTTEQHIRTMMRGRSTLPNQPDLVPTICTAVLKVTCTRSHPIFPSLNQHMFDTPPDQNHVFRLIRVITESYIKIRLHQFGKSQTEKNFW